MHRRFERTNHRSGIVRAHQCLADQKTSRACAVQPKNVIRALHSTLAYDGNAGGDLRQQHFRNGKIGLECAQIAVVDTD